MSRNQSLGDFDVVTGPSGPKPAPLRPVSLSAPAAAATLEPPRPAPAADLAKGKTGRSEG